MGDVSAEPSMEDILSSIKRIIAEEGDPSQPARPRRAARPPIADRLQAARQVEDEILELSERLPAEEIRSRVAEEVRDRLEEEVVAAPIETILSHRAAEASRGSLETLSKLVKPESSGTGDNGLEAVVREMLRPMLREWLDTNLPAMVETMVQREIARITGGE